MENRIVDLNTASVEELTSLPGIGPALAERIIRYRETVHPFEEPVEITAVPGISERMYRAFADRLTVVPPEPSPPPAAEAQPLAEVEALTPPPEELPPLEEGPPPEERGIGAEPSPPEKAPLPAQPGPPPRREAPPPRPALPPVPRPRSRLSWLGSVLLGGLLGGVLGMIFSLLVFAGVNGSLDVGHSRAMVRMENRVESLSAAVDSLQGEVAGLRQRLDVLEGLTARMERAESAVEELRGETAALAQQAATLEEEVNALSEDLAAVQSHAERVESFFHRLQALIGELFGQETPAPTPTPPGQ